MRAPRGMTLGRLFGIEIAVDWSLLIIFLLVSFSLSAGAFPAWHPGWSPLLCWATGLSAAVLFFVSVLLHELSHALVGRARGVGFSRITLFVFGGVAHMEGEPPNWRAEFQMAIVGPVTSLVLGVIFTSLAALFVDLSSLNPSNPAAAMASAGPLPTLLLWLGPINIMLGLFNLVPGFPLDGGRVLRAVAWGITGELRKATRWASNAGQAFAWILMACGLAMMLGLRVPVLGTGLVGGLWLAFIGWFLNNAAVASYRELALREALSRIPVRKLMQTRLTSVPPGMTLSELVDGHMMASGQRSFPVTSEGRLLGLVCLSDLGKRERGKWHEATVADVMTAGERLETANPDEDASTALGKLARREFDQLPVVEDGRLVGLLRRQDLLKWLSLHPELMQEGGAPGRVA